MPDYIPGYIEGQLPKFIYRRSPKVSLRINTQKLNGGKPVDIRPNSRKNDYQFMTVGRGPYIAPNMFELMINEDSTGWLDEISNMQHKEMVTEVQSELDKIFIRDVKNALKITDYRSFLESESWYILISLLYSPILKSHYQVNDDVNSNKALHDFALPVIQNGVSILGFLHAHNYPAFYVDHGLESYSIPHIWYLGMRSKMESTELLDIETLRRLGVPVNTSRLPPGHPTRGTA